MNNQKNQNGRGIFYGVIGVATLVVAIIGATFAYFTASQTNNNIITGNAATIKFDLKVERAETTDIDAGGLIPMSNSMVHTAVSKNTTCVDDNGNSVCQIYKITVTNTSSASMFLDGYVTLANDVGGPLGSPTDVTGTNNVTAMRWAQVFTDNTKFTTAGKTTTGASVADASKGTINGMANSTNAWDSLAFTSAQEAADAYQVPANEQGKNLHNILGAGKTYAHKTDGTSLTSPSVLSDISTTGTIQGNTYDIINRNYIRISDHADGASYTRANDLTSALVFNQYLAATNGSQAFYIVVWLSETGTNQNPDKSADATTRNGIDFFQGTVTFLSAQGGEVTATFSNYATVTPTDTAGAATTATTETTES